MGGISAGSTSLRESTSEIIACPLAGHLGNVVGGSENTGPVHTCLASTSQALRSQTGETTSTEYFAWSSRVWKPAERGRCGLLSAWKERCSGIFSTSSILKNQHRRFLGSRNHKSNNSVDAVSSEALLSVLPVLDHVSIYFRG